MKKTILASILALASASTVAVPLNTNPITSDFYITVGDLDWAWASPVSSVNYGRNVLYTPETQIGWRYATDLEWASHPAPTEFSANSTCASQFWNSGFSHCDYTDTLTNVLTGTSTDIWYVRDVVAQGNVPEPATLALMGLGLAGLGFSRRNK